MLNEQLLEKYLQNTCSSEETKSVLNWLSTPGGNAFAAGHFDKDIELIEQENELFTDHPVRSAFIYQEIHSKINSTEIASAETHDNHFSPSWLKIAAAIFIPLLITNMIFWYIFSKPKKATELVWQEVYVPKGEKLQVMFQDGTKVWLNSDSHLQYPTEFTGAQRQVKLEGEAYFVVRKDPKKPFFVHIKDIDVKVTGTSFDVKAYGDENTVTTTLDEGKISLLVQQKIKPTEYLIKPGQQASFSKSTGTLTLSNTYNKQNSMWKENKLIFKDVPLREMIRVLERWYNVRFVIRDEKILSYTYTLNFQNEPIQQVLFGLEKTTPVDCKLKDGIVEISQRSLCPNN